MKSITSKQRLLSVLLLFCALPALFVSPGAAQPFPAKGTYDFYIFGEPAGSNSFTSCVENNILTIVSNTKVHFDAFDLVIDSKTQVDAKTQRMIALSYKGVERELIKKEGSVHVYGDTISGSVGQNGSLFPSKVVGDVRNTIFFENYVAEHEILLARKYLASGEDFKEIWFFYPADFMLTSSMMSIESEIELETKKGTILCTKISVSLQGGSLFFSYVDTATNIPIYIDFPAVNTEMFYHEYFGDEARSKYSRPAK